MIGLLISLWLGYSYVFGVSSITKDQAYMLLLMIFIELATETFGCLGIGQSLSNRKRRK